jgi:hypothetical protein
MRSPRPLPHGSGLKRRRLVGLLFCHGGRRAAVSVVALRGFMGEIYVTQVDQ